MHKTVTSHQGLQIGLSPELFPLLKDYVENVRNKLPAFEENCPGMLQWHAEHAEAFVAGHYKQSFRGNFCCFWGNI